MKYDFPKDLYTDVRIEHVCSSHIRYSMGEIEELREAQDTGAFIRVYDGKRWYYSAVSDIDSIQRKIDELAACADPNPNITNLKIYGKFSSNKDNCMQYADDNYAKILTEEKIAGFKNLEGLFTGNKDIKHWHLLYRTNYTIKEFYSSKGAQLKFDYQHCFFLCSFNLSADEKVMRGAYYTDSDLFLTDPNLTKAEILREINEYKTFLKDSVPVEKGKYTVIFSPEAGGVFTHECFGHKSESDWVNKGKDDWIIGKQIANSIVSIVDSGTSENILSIPYDDEGNKTQKKYLVKNGILSGQLHQCSTADLFDVPVTGNARAMSFEYKPIVRMINTYIEKGDKSFEQLISETKNGIFVKKVLHGSGMTTFTIAPELAYYIRDGKIAEPVRISVVSGNVFETLNNIDALSDCCEMSFGGCGKMMQFPLTVAKGGPYIRVNGLEVQ